MLHAKYIYVEIVSSPKRGFVMGRLYQEIERLFSGHLDRGSAPCQHPPTFAQ